MLTIVVDVLTAFLAQFFKNMRYIARHVRPFVSEFASKPLELKTSDLLSKGSLEI